MAIQLRRTHQELSDGMLVELPDSRRASHGQVGCLEKYESVQSVPFPSPRAEISEIRPESVISIKAERRLASITCRKFAENPLRAAHNCTRMAHNDSSEHFIRIETVFHELNSRNQRFLSSSQNHPITSSSLILGRQCFVFIS